LSRTTSDSIRINHDALLVAHTEYRYRAEPWLTPDSKNHKRFGKELESVQLTFPSIKHEPTILAMAAWFSVLCKVDDLVEGMDPILARRALQNARNVVLKDPSVAVESEIGKQ